MALIKCPECEKEISDKVKACPHCGYPMVDEEQTIQPQQVTAVKLKTKNSKKIKQIVVISSIVVVLVCIASVFTFFQIKKNKIHEYNKNLHDFLVATSLGADTSEKICSLTKRVWNNSICKERDPLTDEYTISKDTGLFYSEFGEAILSLYDSSDIKAKIRDIYTNQYDCEDLIKKLMSPPSDMQEQYEIASELYSAYQSLTELAVKPTGCYDSYVESQRDKIDNYNQQFNKLEKFIPDDSEIK